MKKELQKAFKQAGKKAKKDDVTGEWILSEQPKLLACQGCKTARYCSKKW